MNPNRQFPWGALAVIAVVLFGLYIWLDGGKEFVNRLSQGPLPLILFPTAAPQTPTPAYKPAPPDPTKNAPNADFFNYVKTAVPTEVRESVRLPQLFSMDTVLMNQYFNDSVYVKANTQVDVISAQRARADKMYTAVTWPDGWLSRLAGINGKVVDGSELSTITTADMFLVVGTTPGHVLAGISDISVTDQVVTVTSNVEMSALYLGLSVSEGNNSPQVENTTIKTPDTRLDGWLSFSSKLPSESDLNNLGLKAVTKEATWLLLHKNGEKLWTEFKTSIEVPGIGHAYDLLVPFVREAFCTKLDTYQKELEKKGKKLNLQACNTNVTINVVLKAIQPTDPNGKPGIEFMKMAQSGGFVQIPDPQFKVIE